jgi:hypothetical protein
MHHHTLIEMPVEEMRQRWAYDPATGVFTRPDGVRVGYVDNHGYVRIAARVGDRTLKFRAHRMAFAYMAGVWPKGEIDHIDGNRRNNSFANLREATVSQNRAHLTVPKRNNTSGVTGVHFHNGKGKWRAEITANKRTVYLGEFASFADAAKARVRAEARYHGEFASPLNEAAINCGL